MRIKTQQKPFILIISAFFLASCNFFNTSNTAQNTNQTTFEIPKPKINLEQPLKISNKPEDLELCQAINRTIDESEYSKARWGIVAISLKDGRVLCGRDAQKLFTPASVEKLLTSIVALDKLGEDFRWKTSLFAKDEIRNGILEGDLVLYGQGSPDFDDEKLKNLVSRLKQKGVREIKGDIIGDESYFKGDNFGDGWTWNELQWYYGAASSALSINQNQVTVILQDGKPKTDSDFVELSGEVRPIEDIEAVGVKRELGTNKVYVWGHGKNLKARIAISQPALFSAKILKEVLEKNGIKVAGQARSVDWKSKDKLDTENALELASVQSKTLAETVGKMNRDSVNLYAELILRTLGKKFGHEAPDENPKMQKLRGDDSAGASVIKKWLKERNVVTDEIAIHDGSGLSRLNNVTPESVGRALIYAANSRFADTFKNSLPVSGQSGTLRGRLTQVPGKILGKTGSIRYVNSLAGFAQRSDETLVFVILGNNITRNEKSSEVIDRITLSLVKD